MKKNIYLIGFMGAGKTTVGALLAEILGLPFEDTDHLIERGEGRTISEIFRVEGEPYFRLRESQVIRSTQNSVPKVIALGGGAILLEENRDFLNKNGHVVYLRTERETLATRLSQNQNQRPLLNFNSLETLFEIRQPLYETGVKSAFTLDTDRKIPSEVAQEISTFLKERDLF
jgi:shikimate kinase